MTEAKELRLSKPAALDTRITASGHIEGLASPFGGVRQAGRQTGLSIGARVTMGLEAAC